jgi:hypothetical protein
VKWVHLPRTRLWLRVDIIDGLTVTKAPSGFVVSLHLSNSDRAIPIDTYADPESAETRASTLMQFLNDEVAGQ